MVWNASPLQRFGNTPGVFTEELMAEHERRGLSRVRLFSLPEVEEAGSFQERLEEIRCAILEGATSEVPASPAHCTGQILATAWADERAPITGIGPVVVNP